MGAEQVSLINLLSRSAFIGAKETFGLQVSVRST